MKSGFYKTLYAFLKPFLERVGVFPSLVLEWFNMDFMAGGS